ncbi:MAG TPA: hypothetical protein VK864_10955 [Longimicrobiales bacterium]|nr:hypothetical protein [Longimicrobiales bacterium]
MPNRNPRRIAILLIDDTHSRTVCSVLLRHRGYRVVEVSAAAELVATAVSECADLVVADANAETNALQDQLLGELPGVSCMFVSGRMDETLVSALDAESRPVPSSGIQ